MNSENSSTVLITGGGSGIGRAIALRFVREGWLVVAVGRRLEPLRELERLSSGRVRGFSVDLRSPEQVSAFATELAHDPALGGRLRALVNNAGIYERRAFAESDDTHWSAMFETNFLGAVRITRAVLPLLRAAGSGSASATTTASVSGQNTAAVINVSSTLGVKPVAETSAYSASKAAMVNWTQTLALELAPLGVRCNCICPGIVDTPIHGFHSQSAEEKARSLGSLQPLGRIGQPDDVAHAVWSLTGPGSEWITGATLTVDGGISL